MTPSDGPARHADAERAARNSYGRLLALLASRTGDIAGAEDALADAFEKALRHWPSDGVPANPDGWLLTVGRNRLRDHWKSAAQRRTARWDDQLAETTADDDADPYDLDTIEDRRLELLLVCAHPAIDRTVHTPLMLNTVLGCAAEQIARAFALPTATLASRLVRAKRRITATGIRFQLPDRTDLPARLGPVLAAVYGGYAIDWSSGPEVRTGLAEEALQLARIVADLTDDPEAHGLAALVCFSRARWPARRDNAGRLVPLAEQDPGRWDRELITQGRRHLSAVPDARQLGRLQLEAAIQAVHCARLDQPDHRADPTVLRGLHRSLFALAPGLGTATALASSEAEVDGPEAGLRSLDDSIAALPQPDSHRAADRFQPAWVTRAHLLHRLGRGTEALTAITTALELTHDPVERAHLEQVRLGWSS